MTNKTPFIYCFSCFRQGKEHWNHKNSHSYMIIDKLDYQVFEQDWTLAEEAQFIKGIENCGIDNWCTLAEHLHYIKNIKELFAHFYTFFYNPLDMATNIGKDSQLFSLNGKNPIDTMKESQK